MASSLVLFLFNAFLSTSMACFPFLSNNASDTKEGVVIEFRFVRKIVKGRIFQRTRNLIEGKVVVGFVGCMFWSTFY